MAGPGAYIYIYIILYILYIIYFTVLDNLERADWSLSESGLRIWSL